MRRERDRQQAVVAERANTGFAMLGTMREQVRAAARSVGRGFGSSARWVRSLFGSGDDQFGSQEVTLYAGLGLFFFGLSYAFDWPVAAILTGMVMMRVAWPHRRAADLGGPSTLPSRDAAPPRSRG